MTAGPMTQRVLALMSTIARGGKREQALEELREIEAAVRGHLWSLCPTEQSSLAIETPGDVASVVELEKPEPTVEDYKAVIDDLREEEEEGLDEFGDGEDVEE